MNRIYKFSPGFIFLFGYFFWNNHSVIIQAGNAIFILLFVAILALIPALIIYFRNKRKNQTNVEILDESKKTIITPDFYQLLSKFIFFIGVFVCVGLLFLRIWA